MRIIFLLRSVVLTGGIERVFSEKANWMATHGHDVLFLTYEQSGLPFSFPIVNNVHYEDMGCQYFTVYRRNLLLRPFFIFMQKWKFAKRLKSVIKKFNPDVLVIPHNLEEFLGQITSALQFVPVVLECHSTYVEQFQSGVGVVARIRQNIKIRQIKRCPLIISLTHNDAAYWNVYCKKVLTIPNPLSVYLERLPNVSKKPFRIICAARLQHIKRVDRLINAFALIASKYPKWYIDVFGDGEEKDLLNALIIEKGLGSQIRLLPPTSNVFIEYMQSQFLVLSSDCESFSLVLVEAMSCALPVVSTDCPYGPSDIINDNVDGLLCKMEVQDLADKMEWMITHGEERTKMGICARESALRFKKDVVMKQWEEAYSSVLK